MLARRGIRCKNATNSRRGKIEYRQRKHASLVNFYRCLSVFRHLLWHLQVAIPYYKPRATMTATPKDRIRARLEVVEEHVRRENAHDLHGIMTTFGQRARYDEPWGEHHDGRDAVRRYYEHLLVSLPDLRIDIAHRLVSEDGVALEVRISGTHIGIWRGLPPTGRRVAFPLCELFTFDEEGKLGSERTYYDRGTVLHQVGLYHNPQTLPGRLETLLAHPVTVARSYARKVTKHPT